MTQQKYLRVLPFAVAVAGLGIWLAGFGWREVVGLILIMWGNNLTLSLPPHQTGGSQS